ncbi:MAG: SDR family oxidoreductase [Paludibacter sp.]|nr:SDR family oxidoreductase [Paludibacter sp.]
MILVTGATGLVGGHLLWHLLQQNDRIIALKRISGNLESLKKIFSFYTVRPDDFMQRIEWRIGDINDRMSLEEALEGVDEIYHCAAIVSLSKGGNELTDTNVEGTRNMVEFALKMNVKKFCFVSSIAACGFASGKHLIDEQTPWTENEHKTMYALSKYNAEQEVWKGIENGLNAVIVNPGVILGLSGNESGSSLIFSRVRKGLMFYTLGGSGYVDVRDVVRAMIQLMNTNVFAERFVLVGENLSNKDIVTMMADGFHKTRPFINVTKELLLIVGCIAEIFGKIFRFKPLIDRSFARSATNRSYYSSKKIVDRLNFNFTPIAQCIKDVCSYMIYKKSPCYKK